MRVDIAQLSARFGVHCERRTARQGFPAFYERMQGRRLLVVTDLTTHPLAGWLKNDLSAHGVACGEYTLPAAEPVADEAAIAEVSAAAEGYDYLLAAGAGTINDLCKYVGKLRETPCGVYPTAPSMDGFTSGVAPLIERGRKVTRASNLVSDVLLDYDLLCAAPRLMIGAGVGDILAKYCCLADWKLSALFTGEEYGQEAASLMEDARAACVAALPALRAGRREGVERLMEALLVSGYSMALAGNSRPASGAEHHMSHYLEMDFLRRGERIPLHGVKVGLGTLVSLYLYRTLYRRRPAVRGGGEAVRLAAGLPTPEYAEEALLSLGCPVRFHEIGVSRETVRRMLFEAYRVRDRFTVLTLYCKQGWMEEAAEEILARYYE